MGDMLTVRVQIEVTHDYDRVAIASTERTVTRGAGARTALMAAVSATQANVCKVLGERYELDTVAPAGEASDATDSPVSN